MSISYYDRNADRFFAETIDADMSADQARFLAHVPPAGAILEAGCGSGRDARAFKNAGYAVTAFDGSAEMARLTSAHTGLAVLHKRFADVDWRDAFDGIWSCASLLHVPRAELPDTMARLAAALRPGGVWYMSFKYGETERLSPSGERRFTDMTETLLAAAVARTGLSLVDLRVSNDARPDRADERWVSAIAGKPA